MSDLKSSKYSNYTCRVAERDSIGSVKYMDSVDDGAMLRVHYFVVRVPSRREFVIRHFHDATEEDRANVICPSKVARDFELWEAQGHAYKYRHSMGHYYWAVAVGRRVDDPLIQLELEMMIDLDSAVTR